METWTNLLCSLLDCGYLDVTFLTDLADKNNIDIDIEDIRSNYGEVNINIIIYEVIREIAWNFIEEHKEDIHKILDLGEFWNIDDYMNSHDIYEIYTNFMDSHLWFQNEQIQELFEKSEYQV